MNCPEQLFECAKKAFESYAQSMCLTTEFVYSEQIEQVPDGVAGAYLTLVSDQGSLLIGLMSDPSGLGFLAKTMLSMEPDDEELEISDIADAMGELANVWAGLYKTELASELLDIRIGLPMFAHGKIDAPRALNTCVYKLVVDVVPVYLYISESLDGVTAKNDDGSDKAA